MHKDYAHIGELHFKVMEEVGELLQAYGKVGRFGAMSKHPNFPEGMTNAEQVIMECEDVVTRVRELKAEMYAIIKKEDEWNTPCDTTDDDKRSIEHITKVVTFDPPLTDIKVVSALVDELDD
jgi:hypothetical protein